MTRVLSTFLISYTFVSSALAASVDGIDVHSVSAGQGPTIVFVHGWTCDTSVWVDQMAEFDDDYRVIALDLPGHGKSGSPSDGQFTMELYWRAIEAVRAEAGIDEMVLVGHSLGVSVIGQYTINHPDRVAGLVGVDGPFFSSTNDQPRRSSSTDGQSQGSPRRARNREELIRGMFVPETPVALQEQILALMLSTSGEMAVALVAPGRERSTRTGEVLNVPALAMYRGTGVPERDIEPTREVLPRTEFTFVSNTGHFLMMEKPVEFNRLLRTFLEDFDY